MRIAITGGSGSLGRQLTADFLGMGADRVVTLTRDEQKRHQLARDFPSPLYRAFAGDIRDRERLADVFRGCDTVVHAAARKVVSGHWDEPQEMLQTNVLGTQNVVWAAREAGVQRLLFISSDKAVNPENVYGVSKAMGEQLVIAANARTHAQGLRLGVLRYGNVLGSNGSVLQAWRSRVLAGQPIQVTDPQMTRFWVTLRTASQFVQAALQQLRGGEVYVPVLQAASVAELALAFLGPDDLGRAESVGLRPGGEKMHEALVTADESRRLVWAKGTLDGQGHWAYVVPPVQGDDSWDTREWGPAATLPTDYRSDVWPLRVNANSLSAMLDGAGMRRQD